MKKYDLCSPLEVIEIKAWLGWFGCVAMFSTPVGILTFYNACKECVSLRSMVQHILESCAWNLISHNWRSSMMTMQFASPKLPFKKICISKIKECYIQSDNTKFLYTHERIKRKLDVVRKIKIAITSHIYSQILDLRQYFSKNGKWYWDASIC